MQRPSREILHWPVVGQQFDYGFDDIANRQTTTRDTRQASYSVNSLNQYTSCDVPGFVNVLGTAMNTATVSLWSPQSTALFTPTTQHRRDVADDHERGGAE